MALSHDLSRAEHLHDAASDAVTEPGQPSAERDQCTLILWSVAIEPFWNPCSGPLVTYALTLAASDGAAPEGASVRKLFRIGVAIPLVLRRLCNESWIHLGQSLGSDSH